MQLTICIVVFVATLVSFALNKLPMWMTALVSMSVLYATGCLDAKAALSGFSNENTILMASMFIVAAGFQKTSFVKRICNKALEMANGSFMKVYVLYIFLTVIITNLISSPVATFAILCPLLGALCESTGTSRSKVMFPALVVTVGCFGLLPLASAVQQASTAQGFLETYGFTETISAMDFFIGKAPMLILLPLWAILIGPKVTPEQPVLPIVSAEKKGGEQELTKRQDLAAALIFFGDILALVFARQLHLEPWFIAWVGAILMPMFGVLDRRSVFKNIPWDMIMLFVGSLSLGTALTETGAGKIVGEGLAALVGGTKNNYVLGGLFFVVPFLVTQFMQNRAVNMIFTPICLLTCQALGANPIGLILMVSAGGLTAFLTPMATPAVAVCMAEGGYDWRSVLKSGWLVALLVSIVYVIYTMTVFPAF